MPISDERLQHVLVQIFRNGSGIALSELMEAYDALIDLQNLRAAVRDHNVCPGHALVRAEAHMYKLANAEEGESVGKTLVARIEELEEAIHEHRDATPDPYEPDLVLYSALRSCRGDD